MNTQAIKERFLAYSKDELVDLLLQIVKTYVVEGTQQFKPEMAIFNVPKYLRELDFPQLIMQLQKHIGLPELGMFKLVNNQVYISMGGRDFLVNPAAMDSIKVRDEARDEPPQARPARQAAATAPREGASVKDILVDDKPKTKAPADDGSVADRFKMLDLD